MAWDSLDPAVGSSDHPVFTDEGAPAEMEASFVLGRMKSKVSASHLGSTPVQVLAFPESSSHLQGHLPGPGARDSVLSVDDPGQTGQHGLNGRDPTAWGDSGCHVVTAKPDPAENIPLPLETLSSPTQTLLTPVMKRGTATPRQACHRRRNRKQAEPPSCQAQPPGWPFLRYLPISIAIHHLKFGSLCTLFPFF